MSNFLVRISIVFFLLAVFYSICLILGSIDLFQTMLSRIGFFLGARAISSFFLIIGCSAGLSLVLGFAVSPLAGEGLSIEKMMLPAGAESGFSSSSESSSPSSNGSTSTSLIGHASDESNSEKEISYSAESPSTSTSTPEDQSNKKKDGLEFIPEHELKHWQTECIRAFNNGLDQVDPYGKMGPITEEDILDALHLDSAFETRAEMQEKCMAL